jgi:hydroxymethylbilane synthase
MPGLTYATRRSPLALAQSRAFAALLAQQPGAETPAELQVVTSGDRIQDRSLAELGGKGLFVKEIEEALLERRADLAVHSLKDVPAVLPQGLLLACIPPREDARDVLVAPRHGTLAALPAGARIGTSSLRRTVSVLRARPDLRVTVMRGNVDTRLRKVDAGECDAVLLARAGLVRLGLEGRATEVLPIDTSLPAPAQGALGIECRADDARARAVLAALHHPDTARAVAAERGVLVAVGGDCRTPLGAHAVRALTLGGMAIRAFVAAPDGSGYREASQVVPWPASDAEAAEAGIALGKTLL